MATWITLSAEDLNDYQVAKIVTAARTKALASGQADPFDIVMPDIVARVRAEIRGCAKNKVSATPLTVPPDLRSQTILLIVEAMQARLPGVALDDDIKTLIADARKYLQRVADCKVPIAQPDDPEPADDVQRGGSIQMGTAKCDPDRVTTRARLNRL